MLKHEEIRKTKNLYFDLVRSPLDSSRNSASFGVCLRFSSAPVIEISRLEVVLIGAQL